MEDLKRSLALAVALAACGAHEAPTPAPAAPSQKSTGDTMATTQLELAPTSDGQGWTLAFRIKNTTARELRAQVLEPFVRFEIEVTSTSGEHLSVAQPAFSVPGQPEPIALAPGESVRITTPFRLQFDPSVTPAGGSDPMVWSIRSAKVPARARVTFSIPGIGDQVAEAALE